MHPIPQHNTLLLLLPLHLILSTLSLLYLLPPPPLLRSPSGQCASTLLASGRQPPRRSHSIPPRKHTSSVPLNSLTLPPPPRPRSRLAAFTACACLPLPVPFYHNNTTQTHRRSLSALLTRPHLLACCERKSAGSRLSCATLDCDRSTPRRVTACLTN